MKITSLRANNFRTLIDLELNFPSYYSAICGKNDSGKTNVVKVIRNVLNVNEGGFVIRSMDELSIRDDFPQWKSNQEETKEIEVNINFLIDEKQDTGLFQFIVDYLGIEQKDLHKLEVGICSHISSESDKNETKVVVKDKEFTGLKAEEILRKFQNSSIVLYHDSVEATNKYFYRRRYLGPFIEISDQFRSEIESIKTNINAGIKELAKNNQEQIQKLLGRLEDKYKVALSVPTYDFDNLPYSITLGDSEIDIDLDEWGSGTQNRTLILLTLFRARQISNSRISAEKITPIIIIEEPESFLHPSAQAQFGRILQELSDEFEVQVITTSHSPYMLSKKDPKSNILLDRKIESGQKRETVCIDTSDENWMEPFGLVLGIPKDEFNPWKKMFMSGCDIALLVEGDLDKEYFEMLLSEEHGDNRLNFDGEILPYDGFGNLQNTVLLNFIKNRYDKLFITYDLDADDKVCKYLEKLGFEREKDFLAIGLNESGRKNIEGLVPDDIRSVVYQNNPDLVSQAIDGDKEEKKSAKNKLKKLMLKEFKEKIQPKDKGFSEYYKISKIINGALDNN